MHKSVDHLILTQTSGAIMSTDESLQSSNYSSPAEMSSDSSYETQFSQIYQMGTMNDPSMEFHSYNQQIHQQQQMMMQMHAQMGVMPGYSTPMEQSPCFNNYPPMGSPMAYPPYPMYSVPFWPPAQPFSADPSPSYAQPLVTYQADSTNQKEGSKKHKNSDRGRVPYTEKQLYILRDRFEKSDRIDRKERDKLSEVLNLSERQIKVWFQNRRYKVRQDKEKAQKEDEMKKKYANTELEH